MKNISYLHNDLDMTLVAFSLKIDIFMFYHVVIFLDKNPNCENIRYNIF